ncbi:hypothetical protein TWF191_001048 [Orbilia oligospora]|uniref:Uncharacterized protein n=1 Tax=Orbilia oligospora TaxID=2813651 RepID=A0A7C8UF63_ORBOL|nr:hypothetical protein TWF191_001048 [Orbilia oligospora]
MFSKENHPKFGYVTSSETKKAISDGNKEFYRTRSHPTKGLKGILSKQYARQHFKVRHTTIGNNVDTGN